MSNGFGMGTSWGFRVPKTAELVAQHVRRQIVLRRLQEGDALPPEGVLMQEFGISRPSLREAVRILESEGLIAVQRGARGGGRVLRPTVDVAARYASVVLQHRQTPLSDVLEARLIVETPAARLVASRRDRKRAAKELTRLIDTVPAGLLGQVHTFNARLVELTGSPTLFMLTTVLEHIGNAAIDTAIDVNPKAVKRFAAAADAARRLIVEAIAAGDGETAEQLWHAHLAAERELLIDGGARMLVDVFPSATGKNAELVAGQLRRSIITGELAVGDQIPAEALLSERFGISRPTLREAFRILESEGLLEVQRGARGGAHIKLPTEDAVARYSCLLLEYERATVADVSMVRSLLEPPCALMIAERNDRAVIARLAAAVMDADATADSVARLRAQHQFHVLLVDSAGNRTISLFHAAMRRILEAAERRSTDVAGAAGEQAQHEGARTHRRLVELLEAGETTRAADMWRRHLEATTTFLERTGSTLDVLALG